MVGVQGSAMEVNPANNVVMALRDPSGPHTSVFIICKGQLIGQAEGTYLASLHTIISVALQYSFLLSEHFDSHYYSTLGGSALYGISRRL